MPGVSTGQCPGGRVRAGGRSGRGGAGVRHVYPAGLRLYQRALPGVTAVGWWYPHEREDRPRREGTAVSRPFSSSLPPPTPGLWAQAEGYLRSRDLSVELARLNGWYPSDQAGSDGRPRLVIPATSRVPGNRFWQARRIDGDDPPRYTSPKAPRGDAVVVVWPRLRPPRGAAIVEGPFDALAAAGEGYLGLAMLGNTPSDEVLDFMTVLLCGQSTSVLVLDEDAPEAAADIVCRLARKGVTAVLRAPYPGKDLAEVPRTLRGVILRGGEA